MGDTFNPQEILSRLRSGQSGSSSVVLRSSQSSPAAQVTGSGNLLGANRLQQNLSSSQPNGKVQAPNSNASLSPAVAPRISKGPLSSVPPPPKQDINSIRLEMEREISRLQQEVSALKTENKQLRADKEDAEKHCIDLKVKSDETISRLRGRLADISLNGSVQPVIDGIGGRMYPARNPSSPHNLQSSGEIKRNNSRSISPPKASHQPAQQQFTDLSNDSFRELTFSEIMRRNTINPPLFENSLRRIQGHQIQAQKPSNTVPLPLQSKSDANFAQTKSQSPARVVNPHDIHRPSVAVGLDGYNFSTHQSWKNENMQSLIRSVDDFEDYYDNDYFTKPNYQENDDKIIVESKRNSNVESMEVLEIDLTN